MISRGRPQAHTHVVRHDLPLLSRVRHDFALATQAILLLKEGHQRSYLGHVGAGRNPERLGHGDALKCHTSIPRRSRRRSRHRIERRAPRPAPCRRRSCSTHAPSSDKYRHPGINVKKRGRCIRLHSYSLPQNPKRASAAVAVCFHSSKVLAALLSTGTDCLSFAGSASPLQKLHSAHRCKWRVKH